MTTTITNGLTRQETTRREELEAIISKKLSLFHRLQRDIGAALRELKDRKLYRSTHDTWAAYCQDVLGRSARTANRIVAAHISAIADADSKNTTVENEAVPTKSGQNAVFFGHDTHQKQDGNEAGTTAGDNGEPASSVESHGPSTENATGEKTTVENESLATKSGQNAVFFGHDQAVQGPKEDVGNPNETGGADSGKNPERPRVPPTLSQLAQGKGNLNGGQPAQHPGTAGGQPRKSGEATEALIESGISREEIQAVQHFISAVYRFHVSTWNTPPPPAPMVIVDAIVRELERVKHLTKV